MSLILTKGVVRIKEEYWVLHRRLQWVSSKFTYKVQILEKPYILIHVRGESDIFLSTLFHGRKDYAIFYELYSMEHSLVHKKLQR